MKSASGHSLRLLKKLKKRRTWFLAGTLTAFSLAAACSDETIGTPTLFPQPTSVATSTPVVSEIARQRVRTIFESQIAAIQEGDWAAVYQTCTPEFRSSRTLERFTQDANTQFRRDGYRADGFEARNIDPLLRAPDRIRVKWDAFQDGVFIRTEEIGQTYILTQGRWFDDGAWCR